MPSPQELGISTDRGPGEGNYDWGIVYRRFREAGATCFQVDHPAEGGCKLAGVFPTGQPNRTHRIDVRGESEEETAKEALKMLKEWQTSRTALKR